MTNEDKIKCLIRDVRANIKPYEDFRDLFDRIFMCTHPQLKLKLHDTCYDVEHVAKNMTLRQLITSHVGKDNDFLIRLTGTFDGYYCEIICSFVNLFTTMTTPNATLQPISWNISHEKKIIIHDNVSIGAKDVIRTFVDKNIIRGFEHIDFSPSYRPNGKTICYELLINIRKLRHVPTDILRVVVEFGVAMYY